MILIAGTLPYQDFPLTFAPVKRDGNNLLAGEQYFPCTQGTSAMITAALTVTDYLKLPPPHVLVAGDIGDGRGTREMFAYLTDNITALQPEVLSLHYCLPIMTLMKRLCQTVARNGRKPFLIADAGAMYAAKAAKLAPMFDIFTPDPSEIAFLADPEATHPAYISRHLFAADASRIPSQIETACRNGDAARLLIVKGAIDYIAMEGKILHAIREPDIPSLEPIGGTGDTITGMVSALVYAGYKPVDAAVIAVRTNRAAGEMAQPTPATTVREIVDRFPDVFRKNLAVWGSAPEK
ncbi:MAG: NAD(P)H-hydrate dehydratase [Chloroflexota bacterium]